MYATNEWHYGSGEGSLPRHTRGYVEFLQRFLNNKLIRSVVDMGCGDWQFSRLLDWTGIDYHGFDVVRSVIETNQRRFAQNHIHFTCYTGNFAELPAADLLIAKDVLQHLSYANIEKFIPHLQRYRFALITNCVHPSKETVNRDIADGEFRYLDLRKPPFQVQAEEVFSFTNHRPAWLRWLIQVRWRKKVLLVDNSAHFN